MSLEYKKSTCQTLKEKYEAANCREPQILKTLSNNRILLERVLRMQDDMEPLPSDSTYASFNEWVDDLEKAVSSGEKSLERIEDQKAAIVALDYYIDNAA